MKRIFTIAVALAGMTLASGCVTPRDNGYDRSDRRMDSRDLGSVSVNFGSVAFGYSDGTGTADAAGINGIMMGSARVIAAIKAIITMIGTMIAMAMTAGMVAKSTLIV